MSWFSSTFSRSNEDEFGKREQDDEGERSPSQGGKGVTDEFSELTKNLTRQLWGVASFLAPPPNTTQVESPKHTNTPQTEPHNIGKSEDPQVNVGVVAIEEKDFTVAEGARMESQNSNSSASGSPSASQLTGFRNDLAELKGTMATGFSRIQTVIRAVTQDEEEEEDVEDDVAEKFSLAGDSGLSSLLKPLLVSISSFRERLPRNERGEESPLVEHVEGNIDYESRPKPTGQSSLAGSIGGLSRLATSLIPYARDIVGEISGRDYYAVALTDEVVAFADNIAMHPETWLDFPLPEEEGNDDFEMTEIQQEHAKVVDELSSRLAAVHRELCPAFISDGRFWKIYFVLLHSRLNKEDAELLSTSQVLKTRELLLQIQKQEPRVVLDTAPTESEREELGLTESNMVQLPYEHVAHEEEHLKSSAESASSPPIMEEVSLDDASHPKSESSVATDVEEEAHNSSSSVRSAPLKLDDNEEADVDAWLDEEEENDVKETADRGAAVSLDEDVSFSDLEDDDDESSKKEDGSHPVKRNVNSNQASSQGDVSSGSSKPEGDWLTVNKEDVTSPTSSSP